MNYRKIISLVLIIVLIAPWLAPAGKVSAEASFPVPGKGGLITIKPTGDNNVEVHWEYADSSTPSYELKYQVYVSVYPNLKDMEEIRDSLDYGNDDWISGAESEDGTFSREFMGLSDSVTYYFNVIVNDGKGMESAYQMQSYDPSTQLSELDQFNEIKKR